VLRRSEDHDFGNKAILSASFDRAPAFRATRVLVGSHHARALPRLDEQTGQYPIARSRRWPDDERLRLLTRSAYSRSVRQQADRGVITSLLVAERPARTSFGREADAYVQGLRA